MYYAGIGSRETPEHIGVIMTNIASRLEVAGWTLRSGGAAGADTFFENGVRNPSNKQIYIHKERVHDRRHDPRFGIYNAQRCEDYADAEKLASEVHPVWHRCNDSARQLHARNVFQVLGPGFLGPFVDHSRFLVCWAIPDIHGVPEGGTRTAWNIAVKYNIPRFNLAVKDDRVRIEDWLSRKAA